VPALKNLGKLSQRPEQWQKLKRSQEKLQLHRLLIESRLRIYKEKLKLNYREKDSIQKCLKLNLKIILRLNLKENSQKLKSGNSKKQ